MTRILPPQPNLDHLKNEAKALLKSHRASQASACKTLRLLHCFRHSSDEQILGADLALHEAQFTLAMDYGFKNWQTLKRHVEFLSGEASQARDYSHISLRGDGHSDDHFSLTFAAAARLLGRDVPYEQVLPLSLNPFAPAFYLPEACPSFWHQQGRAHGLDILTRRFGFYCEELRLPDTGINPVSQAERFKSEHLTKVAKILREYLQRGCVVFVETGWAAPEGGSFVSWLWSGLVEETRTDGMIVGATLNGQHDNYLVDPGRCWALSLDEPDIDDSQAEREAIERVVHRIRADRPPFEPGGQMAYGVEAMDAWVEKMDNVPFCGPCVESAPDPDRARGWSCARDCATSVCEGAAAASRALRRWSLDFAPVAGRYLRAAADQYENIAARLRPFTSWEKGRGYHAMMGNRQEQKQHAKDVLQPVRDELAKAADEIEKALADIKD